jgi:hypothetical protein
MTSVVDQAVDIATYQFVMSKAWSALGGAAAQAAHDVDESQEALPETALQSHRQFTEREVETLYYISGCDSRATFSLILIRLTWCNRVFPV